MAASLSSPAQNRATVLAYAGSYTPSGQGNGKGIYLLRMNTSTGALTQVKVFPGDTNPGWLTFGAGQRCLYAANEVSNFNGTKSGSVSAYAADASSGDLRLLNTVSSEGAGPAHISVEPSGRYVLVANYDGGTVAVLPIKRDGSLGKATDVKKTAEICKPPCATGPEHAKAGPPGSFSISGHDAPHAHMIGTDPSGNFAIANDLGIDRTIVWKFDREHGTLSNPTSAASSPGAGPRHFVFHPGKPWFYCLNEESSTLTFMSWNAGAGTLHPEGEISTLPAGFAGTNFPSELLISRDGRFLYATNRVHDSIAIFAVGSNGAPKLLDEVWTRGDYPRHCAIDPTGRFLYSCNHKGDNITCYRIEEGGGKLVFTGQYTPVGSPAVLVFRQ